jgi:hopanoid biosynthesis associated radical SAM protein HpnH
VGMIFPWQLTTRLSGYLAGKKLRGRRRFPYVLMLEPLFRCNLACAGCGRIREFGDVIDRTLSREESVAAVDESGAPVVSITGGEPLIHPQIDGIVADIARRRRFVYLCTNGVLLERSLAKFQPGPYLSFVVHLDGEATTHDRNAGRPGVFDQALAGIRAAKAAGFQVRTNTTIYRNSDLDEVRRLFRTLADCGVDGIMVSPAFSFDTVDSDIFLTRAEAHRIFRRLAPYSRSFRYCNTPAYWDFLSGRTSLQCTPWSNPTRNPIGWKRPCYLITDGHAATFRELMEETAWERYGVGNDPRCANCMLHSGFEASAIEAAGGSPRELWRMAKWSLLGA